ncbi:MAG: carbohydrate ABC transporter permease, partial [Clostridiaceae bacterium]|nr:carbohydrate ABC transporter permease [Clostridiaceae bacterium]
MNSNSLSKKKDVLFSFLSIIILCFLLFPLFWILVTSFKTEQEIFQIPPTFYPHILNTKSYVAQLETGDFNMFHSFGNSLLISSGAVLIAVLLAVPASYAIAKYRYKGRKSMLLFFLVTQMLPVSVLLTPMFIMFKGMHIYNTWWAAILADAT